MTKRKENVITELYPIIYVHSRYWKSYERSKREVIVINTKLVGLVCWKQINKMYKWFLG